MITSPTIPGSARTRAVQRREDGHGYAGRRRAALQVLEQAGWIRRAVEASGGDVPETTGKYLLAS